MCQIVEGVEAVQVGMRSGASGAARFDGRESKKIQECQGSGGGISVGVSGQWRCAEGPDRQHACATLLASEKSSRVNEGRSGSPPDSSFC